MTVTVSVRILPSAVRYGISRPSTVTEVTASAQGMAMEARSVKQTEVFAAAKEFAQIEGILPAPESSHAIKVAIDEAIKCRETGEHKNILFGLTGTGYFDMASYEKFNNGVMTDYEPTDEEIEKGLAGLPKLDF